jgi:NitT/TauT family transport system ATP-binding protein
MDEAIYLSDRILILGQKPSHIVREISIAEKNRTRQWLYEQSELRKTIYQTIMGGSR